MPALHNKAVLRAVQGVLAASAAVSPGPNLDMAAAPAISRSPRTFLAAVLVVHHPSYVFDEDTSPLPRSISLVAAAQRLLEALAYLVGVMDDGPGFGSAELYESFLRFDAARHHWLHCFLRWKKEDERRIGSMLVASYHELLATQRSVLGQETTTVPPGSLTPDQEMWLAPIERQRLQILDQIRRLLGPAEAERLLATGSSDSPPEMKAATVVSTQPPATPEAPEAKATNPASPKKTGLKAGFLIGRKSSQVPPSPNLRAPKRPAPSPPASPELSRTPASSSSTPEAIPVIPMPPAAGLPSSNWELLESLRDTSKSGPPQDAPNSLASAVRTTVAQCLKDQLVAAIQAKDYKLVQANLVALRERLLCFVPTGHRLCNEIMEGMDIESIFARASELDQDRLVLLLQFFTQKVLFLEAPARNRETQEWIDKTIQELGARPPLETVLPGILEWLFAKLGQLGEDLLQARKEMIRDAIPEAEIAAYQRSQIVQEIQSGKFRLDHTTAWLEAAKAASPPGSASRGIARRGFLKLLEQESFDAENFPESLAAHREAIHQAMNEIQTIVAGEALCLGVKQLLMPLRLKPAVLETSLRRVKDGLTEALRSPTLTQASLQEDLIRLVRHEFAGAGGAALSSEDEARLRKMARNAASRADPVTGLITRRVMALLGHQLLQEGGASSEESLCNIRNTRQSLSLHQSEVEALGKSLLNTVERVEALFGEVHDLILASAK